MTHPPETVRPDWLAGVLEDAERWAREAGDLTLQYFGGRVPFDAKMDGSPVTEADRGAEALLRERILARFPDHSVLGEEFGSHTGRAPIRWILDPIDGTRSFMRGVPLYGVLMGLEVADTPVLGIAYFPALDEMVSAAKGLGCFWRGVRCHVSPSNNLAEATLLTTDPVSTAASPLCAGFESLAGSVDVVRSWGDAYGHALVATGRAEIMVDPILSPWDAAPLYTLLTEAGGRFTDLEGRPDIHGGSGLSTNGHLHQLALERVNPR
jgi:histidinol phosphatase-like enzyme (inositol monophosphatase family)